MTKISRVSLHDMQRLTGATLQASDVAVDSAPDLPVLARERDPPALPGRQSEFDNSGRPKRTPNREPPSITKGSKHEARQEFKPQPMGV